MGRARGVGYPFHVYGMLRTDIDSDSPLSLGFDSKKIPMDQIAVGMRVEANTRSRAFKIEWVFKVIKVIVTSAVTTMRPLR